MIEDITNKFITPPLSYIRKPSVKVPEIEKLEIVHKYDVFLKKIRCSQHYHEANGGNRTRISPSFHPTVILESFTNWVQANTSLEYFVRLEESDVANY